MSERVRPRTTKEARANFYERKGWSVYGSLCKYLSRLNSSRLSTQRNENVVG